jgi:hypothetical protein
MLESSELETPAARWARAQKPCRQNEIQSHQLWPGQVSQNKCQDLGVARRLPLVVDTVIPAPVQSSHVYTWNDIRLNHQFVEVYREIDGNSLTVDYSLIHTTKSISKS